MHKTNRRLDGLQGIFWRHGSRVVVANVTVTSQEPLVKRIFDVAVQGISNSLSLVVVASGASLLAEISSFDNCWNRRLRKPVFSRFQPWNPAGNPDALLLRKILHCTYSWHPLCDCDDDNAWFLRPHVMHPGASLRAGPFAELVTNFGIFLFKCSIPYQISDKFLQ